MTDLAPEETVTATDFKARCLEIMDRLSARALRRVTVTKRGRVVAVLTPPVTDEARPALHGCMRGSVRLAGAELSESTGAVPWPTRAGVLPR